MLPKIVTAIYYYFSVTSVIGWLDDILGECGVVDSPCHVYQPTRVSNSGIHYVEEFGGVIVA